MESTEDDVKFSRLAIDQARKSMPEDTRVHPFVGAVAVKDGEIMATACRGETGAGDHAEYGLLERKLEQLSLVGTTIYTSLEPCTSRKHPKVPCAKRLSERGVARVVIGILDPNPEIRGEGVLKLREARVP